MDEITAEFLEEAEEMLAALSRILAGTGAVPAPDWGGAYRSVHVIRGAAGFLGMPRIERLAAAGELLFGRLEAGTIPATGDRLEAGRRIHGALAELIGAVRREGREPPGDDGPLLEWLAGVVEP